MSNISRIQPETTKQTPQIVGQYIALISQAGTANPTTVVIKNTLPTAERPVWTRETNGIYRFTSTNINYFPVGLVTYSLTNNMAIQTGFRMVHASPDEITIVTQVGGVATDSKLAFTPIQIIIWDRLQD